MRQLDDKDLTVVQAALNVDGLSNVIGSSELLEALQNVLRRCVGKLLSGMCGKKLSSFLFICHIELLKH